MTLIIPNAAEEVFLDAILSTNYTLRLFTNDPVAGLTPPQIEALDETDFTEATFPGYAGAALTGGIWTTTQGDPSEGTYAQQTFTRSSTGAPQIVRGYYVVRTTGGLLRWFEYFPGPLTVEFINDAIAITPTFTLDDDKEATVTARGTVARQSLTTNDSARAAGVATDMTLTADFDSTRLYAVHFSSQANLGSAVVVVPDLYVDGLPFDRLARSSGTSATWYYDGTSLYEPATGSHTLTVRNNTGSGDTLQLTGGVTQKREFWVEDVGPR